MLDESYDERRVFPIIQNRRFMESYAVYGVRLQVPLRLAETVREGITEILKVAKTTDVEPMGENRRRIDEFCQALKNLTSGSCLVGILLMESRCSCWIRYRNQFCPASNQIH